MLTAKDKKGIWLIVGVGLALGSLLVAGIIFEPPEPGPDNCVGAPQASTVVVIDNSQSITEQTRREVSARILSFVRDSVQQNERVSLFRVSAISSDSLVPVFSRCRLQRDGNDLYEDARTMTRQFTERFQAPLEEAVSKLPSNSPSSPIAQAMIDISLSEYLGPSATRLVVFSDLLENTPAFSLYGCVDGDVAIKNFRESRRGAQERPKFRGTSVFLNVIPRVNLPTQTTSGCRDKFWMWFFGDNPGGSLTPAFLPGR